MSSLSYLNATVYYALPEYIDHFLGEISASPLHIDGDLYTFPSKAQKVYWVKNIWYKPFIAEFNSINDAVNLLKNIQRN